MWIGAVLYADSSLPLRLRATTIGKSVIFDRVSGRPYLRIHGWSVVSSLCFFLRSETQATCYPVLVRLWLEKTGASLKKRKRTAPSSHGWLPSERRSNNTKARLKPWHRSLQKSTRCSPYDKMWRTRDSDKPAQSTRAVTLPSYFSLVVGCWLLFCCCFVVVLLLFCCCFVVVLLWVVGCWLLVVGCWLLVVGCCVVEQGGVEEGKGRPRSWSTPRSHCIKNEKKNDKPTWLKKDSPITFLLPSFLSPHPTPFLVTALPRWEKGFVAVTVPQENFTGTVITVPPKSKKKLCKCVASSGLAGERCRNCWWNRSTNTRPQRHICTGSTWLWTFLSSQLDRADSQVWNGPWSWNRHKRRKKQRQTQKNKTKTNNKTHTHQKQHRKQHKNTKNTHKQHKTHAKTHKKNLRSSGGRSSGKALHRLQKLIFPETIKMKNMKNCFLKIENKSKKRTDFSRTQKKYGPNKMNNSFLQKWKWIEKMKKVWKKNGSKKWRTALTKWKCIKKI